MESRDQNLDDLKEFLSVKSEFTQKSEVSYFLSEVRKIIERNNECPNLCFYCNWALHSKLTKKSTIKILNSKLGRFVDFNKNKREIQKMIRYVDDGKFIKMEDFKIELMRFLKDKSLPQGILAGNKWWKFIKIYLEIIYRCPITQNASGISSLCLTKEKDGYYYEFFVSKGTRIPRIKLKINKK